MLLTGHYSCICRNTAQTAHTELLDDRKLYLLSVEARCQTASSVYTDLADKHHVASPAPKRHNDVILEKLFGDNPLQDVSPG